MGKVFKKVFKPIQKLVPKSLRPYVPYATAFIPGGMGLSAGLQSMGGSAFLKAAIARGMIDPDASIGDSLKTGLMAASPQAISSGVGSLAQGSGRVADFLNKTKTLKDGTKTISIVDKLSSMANPETLGGAAKVAGTLGTVEAAAQLAELNQEEIDKYNDSLGGNLDRGERRAQLTAIFTRAGYEPDYVDQMLTTYGYAQGGIAGLRSGYENGGTVTITQEEYDRLRSNKMGTKEGLGFATEGLGMLGKSGHSREPVPMLRFAQGGEVMDVEDIDSTYTSSGAGFEPEGGIGTQFDALYKDTVGKRYPEISIDSELARRARKYMQMGGIESAEAAYSLAEQEYMEELMSEYPNLTSSIGMATGGEVIEESETLMAGGPYKSGRDVQDAFNVWSGMGADDKSLFEGFLDFYKNGSWRDQIMGQADVEENTMMASAPSLEDSLNEKSLMMFRKPYHELTEEEVELLNEMATGGRVGYAGGGASYNKSERYSILAKKFNKGIPLTPDEAAELEMLEMTYADPHKMAQGGIMNRNLLNTGVDKDMRGGGFIPEGTKEKADDVPARLSKNEFVMTADAVRAAGGGSVNKGAQRMYNIMNQLEAKA